MGQQQFVGQNVGYTAQQQIPQQQFSQQYPQQQYQQQQFG